MEINSIDSRSVIELGQSLKSVEQNEENVKQAVAKKEEVVKKAVESTQVSKVNSESNEQGKVLDLLG